MDFLTKLASVKAEAAKIRESMTIVDPRTADLDIRPERGERAIRRGTGAAYERKVIECTRLIADVIMGRRPEWHLKEAMSTSDFPNLMGDVMYRMMLGNYIAYPVTYPSWTRAVSVKDFRSLHMYTLDGGQAILDKVKEYAPYKETSFSETAYSVAVAKYGRRYGLSFELITNDDLNAFNERPMLMAQSAKSSEEYLATQMLCDSTGPHPTFFTAGHKNIVTSNPKLSIQGLQTAYAVMASQLNADGVPIVIKGVKLVVPQQLEITAENIMNAIQIRINSSEGNPTGALPGGATLDQFLYTANWMAKRTQLSVNPFLPIINTTSGASSWYLIADPADVTQRPAIVFAHLRGHELPELFMKDPDSRQLGGGGGDPMDGSFDNDSVDYKLRCFMGAAQIDPKMAVSSTGLEV